MRILVTGGNGDIGEAIGRILRESYPDAVVDGADAAGQWPGSFIFQRMHSLPLARTAEYTTALAELGAQYDLVIPSTEPELTRLAADRGPAASLPLLKIADDLLAIFLDKLETARWLSARNLQAARSTALADARESDLPLLLKPRRGAGGRGQEIVRTPARLALAKQELPETTVAQQLLEVADQEYTCALFASGGDIRSLVLHRWLVGGKTGKAIVADLPVVTRLLEDIAKAANLTGCINVQLRLLPDGPRIFEINPRLSSTVMIRHRLGFRDLLWWIDAFFGRKPAPAIMPQAGAMAYSMAIERFVPAS